MYEQCRYIAPQSIQRQKHRHVSQHKNTWKALKCKPSAPMGQYAHAHKYNACTWKMAAHTYGYVMESAGSRQRSSFRENPTNVLTFVARWVRDINVRMHRCSRSEIWHNRQTDTQTNPTTITLAVHAHRGLIIQQPQRPKSLQNSPNKQKFSAQQSQHQWPYRHQCYNNGKHTGCTLSFH